MGGGKTIPERVWPLGAGNGMPAMYCSASLVPQLGVAPRKKSADDQNGSMFAAVRALETFAV